MEEDRLAGHRNRPGKEEEVALSPHREEKKRLQGEGASRGGSTRLSAILWGSAPQEMAAPFRRTPWESGLKVRFEVRFGACRLT